jgi:hypothetical protein
VIYYVIFLYLLLLFLFHFRFAKIKTEQPVDNVSKNRFNKALCRLARQRGWVESRCFYNNRGYKVKMPRVQSRKKTDKSLRNAVDRFLQQPAQFLGLWERVWTGAVKEYGAISRCNIPEYTIIAEYVGEEISKKLADEREEEYQKAKKPYTMIDLSGMAHHLLVYQMLFLTCYDCFPLHIKLTIILMTNP